jgi:hypothetical protein
MNRWTEINQSINQLIINQSINQSTYQLMCEKATSNNYIHVKVDFPRKN